jgi:hypothetical protein
MSRSLRANGSAFAEFEGHMDGFQWMYNERDQRLLPRSFGVRWIPGTATAWRLEVAWVRGVAVLAGGKVGTAGRYGRWREYEGMPEWLEQIAQAGPFGAPTVTKALNHRADW